MEHNKKITFEDAEMIVYDQYRNDYCAYCKGGIYDPKSVSNKKIIECATVRLALKEVI